MSDESPAGPPMDDDSEVVVEAMSREDGKNSTVRVYRDRIEWLKQESISSLPRSKSDPPVIPLHTVRSVKARTDGPLFSKVLIRTERSTVVFRMHSPQAVEVRDIIQDLLAGRPVASVESTAPSAAAPAPEPGGDDLRQLELLRDEGFLTSEQFEEARAQLGST